MSNASEWRTQVFDVLAHDRLLPLRNAVRRGTWLGEGLRQRLEMSVDDSPIVPGLLSIVMPAYGVEDYIEESLDSLSRQDYRKIEVIVVDDGSPDRSREIVRSYMRRDPRVKLVRKQNQGLGAARNTGVEHARGEFLAFLDSDDTVDRFVYREAIESLHATGSDFAVTPYRRLVKGELQSAAWWINEAHARYRPACTLGDFPQIMVNAVAWTKIYRRTFWNAQAFSFPVGVLYEDQELSARAYAHAAAFDVMPRIGINWRIRENLSSITQNAVSLRNIVDHWCAAEASLDALRAAGMTDAHDARLLQYLNFNMAEFLPQIRAMEPPAWDAFREAVARLLSRLPAHSWPQVDARSKVLLLLVRNGDRDDALRFLEQQGWERHRFAGRPLGDRVVADLPGRGEFRLPDDAFDFSAGETKLIAMLRGAEFDRDRRVLSLRVLTFIDGIDCQHHPQEVQLTLIEDATERRVDAAMTRTPRAHDALGHPRPYCDVSQQVWSADIDLDQLADASRWRVVVTARTGDIERSEGLGYDRRSPAVDPHWVDISRRYSLLADPQGRLHVTATDLTGPVVTAMDFSDQEELTVRLRSETPLPAELSFRDVDDRLGLPRSITAVPATAEGTAMVRLRFPRTLNEPDGVRQCFVLQARSGDGGWDNLPAGEDVQITYNPDRSWSVRPHWPTLQEATADGYHEFPIRPGDATLVRHRAAAMVTQIALDGEELVLHGDLLPVGARACGAEVTIRSHRTPAFWKREGADSVAVRVPLRDDPWGWGERPIPSGPQSIAATVDGAAVVLDAEDDLAHGFPEELQTPDLLVSFQRDPDTAALVAQGHAPLPTRDRERGNALRLQREAAALVGTAARPFALFRSLYGEVANDSALSVHERLIARGTDLELVWAVRDASVPVPAGARTVLENSREYFEAFARADFLMVNVHQPDWHHRPAHQQIIETFHGYPFKQNGISWWRALGFPPERIESFLRRSREWDFLVSPAHYATSPLLEFFPERDPGATNILEIGYPRNDALFGERAAERRLEVRRRLGLRDDQVAVLYAPTFRDYVSVDDMTAQMIDFLDYEAVVEHFGDRLVILGRGHPFNARVGTQLDRQVLNVTDYPDINDLIVASDAAIVDYSSLRFDYALTRKPMIFLVPDLERYFNGRTSFVPFEATAPGPWVSTTRELIAMLESLDAVKRRYSDDIERFIGAYMEKEDGHASDRLIDAVFVPSGRVAPYP